MAMVQEKIGEKKHMELPGIVKFFLLQMLVSWAIAYFMYRVFPKIYERIFIPKIEDPSVDEEMGEFEGESAPEDSEDSAYRNALNRAIEASQKEQLTVMQPRRGTDLSSLAKMSSFDPKHPIQGYERRSYNEADILSEPREEGKANVILNE